MERISTNPINHYNKWVVGAFIGFTWALWHLPLVWVPGVFGYYQEPIFGIFLSTIALSLIMIWIYERTENSLLPILLFHTMFNSSHVLFPIFGNDTASLWYLILLCGLATGLIIQDTLTQKDTAS